jgi:hypothetical protein
VGSPIFHGIQLLGLIVRFFRNSLHFLLKIPNGLVKISAKTPSEVGGEGGNNLDIHHKSALCIHFPPVIIEMCKLISVRFWNFKDGGSLKAIFLAKTQHTQRKKIKNSVDAMVKVIYLHHKFITKSMNQIIKISRF